MEIATVVMNCRGVNLTSALTTAGQPQAASANTDLADAVVKELQTLTDEFDKDGTMLSGNIQVDSTELTFSFEVTLKLKHPARIY